MAMGLHLYEQACNEASNSPHQLTLFWFLVSATGPAYASELLPETRRARINPARNSQLYVKQLEARDEMTAEPGKRIGF